MKKKPKDKDLGASKEQLLEIVAHDLKNPLSFIKSTSNCLLNDGASFTKEQNELIQSIYEGAIFSLDLIKNILEEARLYNDNSINAQWFKLSQAIELTLRFLQTEISRKKLQIISESLEDIEVFADYGMFQQVMGNLIGNAVKFSPIGAKIIIKAKNPNQNNFKDTLELFIVDEGPGIPKGEEENIFERFHQARKEDREIGTGLGLSICKRICELHNGKLSAKSNEEKGSTFSLIFPNIRKVKKVMTLNENINVLLVDDQAAIRKLTKSRLHKKNYSVVEASNGKDALQKIEENNIDVVILDLEMPGLNGFDIMPEIKKKGIPIVVYTSKESQDIDLLTKYSSGYMQKPANAHEINARIHEALGVFAEGSSVEDAKKDSTVFSLIFANDSKTLKQLEYLSYKSKQHPIFIKHWAELYFFLQKYPIHQIIIDTQCLDINFRQTVQEIQEIKNNYSTKILFVGDYGYKRQNKKTAKMLDIELIEPNKLERYFINEIDARESQDVRVLLVDDDIANTKLLNAFLKKTPYVFESAQDCSEALDLVQKQHFDIIFTDYYLPDNNGDYLVQKIRELEKQQEICRHWIVGISARKCKNLEKTKFLYDEFCEKPIMKDKIITLIDTYNKRNQALKNSDRESGNVLDISELIHYIKLEDNVDSALANELIEDFLRNMPQLIKSLKEDIGRKKNKRISERAHELKNRCAQLGLNRLADIFWQIETSETIKKASLLSKSIDAIYKESVQALEKYKKAS